MRSGRAEQSFEYGCPCVNKVKHLDRMNLLANWTISEFGRISASKAAAQTHGSHRPKSQCSRFEDQPTHSRGLETTDIHASFSAGLYDETVREVNVGPLS